MAGLVAGGLASAFLSSCGRSATCTSKPPETSQKVVFQSVEWRTVRPSPADGPQVISKSHSEMVCFSNPICLCTADGPRYSTGRSAVHFLTITQNQTFSGTRLEFHRQTVRALRADGPRLLYHYAVTAQSAFCFDAFACLILYNLYKITYSSE